MINEHSNSTNLTRIFYSMAIIIQVGVLIWGAAAITTKVADLSLSVSALNSGLASFQSVANDLRVQNARLEVRLDNLEARDENRKLGVP